MYTHIYINIHIHTPYHSEKTRWLGFEADALRVVSASTRTALICTTLVRTFLHQHIIYSCVVLRCVHVCCDESFDCHEHDESSAS